MTMTMKHGQSVLWLKAGGYSRVTERYHIQIQKVLPKTNHWALMVQKLC